MKKGSRSAGGSVDAYAKLDPRLRSIVDRAEAAYQSFDHASALDAYTEALAWEEPHALPIDLRFRLLIQRAETYRALGDHTAMVEDITSLKPLAVKSKQPQLLAEAALRLADIGQALGDVESLIKLAEKALKLARAQGDVGPEAIALTALGGIYSNVEDPEQTERYLTQALPLFEGPDEPLAQVMCLRLLARVPGSQQADAAEGYIEEALRVARRAGDQRIEAAVLAAAVIHASGADAKRRYGELCLALSQELGLQERTAAALNHLSLVYFHLGLYQTALAYIQEAISIARQGLHPTETSAFLETYARVALALDDIPAAEEAFNEALDIAGQHQIRGIIAYNVLGLGRIRLLTGDPKAAAESIQSAIDLFRETGATVELAVSLGAMAEVHLAQKDWNTALEAAREAVTELGKANEVNQDFPPQDVWWTYYQVLVARPKRRKYLDPSDRSLGTLGEEAGRALHRALELARANIAAINDDGLRRSYWNKVEINRRILLENARLTQTAEDPATAIGPSTGDIQAQLQRMLDIGVRMNEIRDPDELVDFVMDQFVELSGAEDAALILVGEDSARTCPAQRGFVSGADPVEAAGPALDEATRGAQAVLRQGVADHNPSKPAKDAFDNLSVLAVPVAAHGRLIGWLYADNHNLFGPFTPSDLTLISAFAIQVAAAMDNAGLYRDLEERVEERTQALSDANQALEDRAAELSIINGIQQALASQLDIREIFNLVGDRIQQVFDAQIVGIITYDPEDDMMDFRYAVEKGQHFVIPRQAPSGFSEHIIRTGQALVINEDMPAASEKYRAPVITGEEIKSYVGVPLVVGGEVRGGISLQNIDREHAFTDSDVGLLTTLASSMSVALENARLFDETNRLLDETRQRAAELSLINSIQHALAAELDMASIYETVGVELRSIFGSQVVTIYSADLESHRMHTLYGFEKGQRLDLVDVPLNSLYDWFLAQTETVVFNRDFPEFAVKFSDYSVPQGEMPRSIITVPIPHRARSRTVELLSIQDIDGGRLFTEADVRLLETLAGSMGVALENARLLEETKRLLNETEQRAAELSIINSVQQGLSSNLEMRAIYNLVGNRIRDIFDAQVVHIRMYDAKTDFMTFPFVLDRDERLDVPGMKVDGIGVSGEVIRTRKPILVNRDYRAWAESLGSYLLEGQKEWPKSALGCPIMVGDNITGIVLVQNFDSEDVFSDSDVSLLTTLASSMSVALENARLFDETNHLLDETRQRNAELGVINSIQQGLASQLDMQALFTLVGDKIREIFDAQVVDILTYDRTTNLCHYQYMVEKGEKLGAPPFTPAGFSGQILKDREPMMVNRDLAARAVEHGSRAHAGEMPKSYLGVPLVRGDTAVGVISLQNIDREDAFGDSDLRLLTTLASSMSVALENARLFNETNRLLEEARQRNSELAAVNTISQALVAETEIDNLIQLVGEQVRTTFQADIAYVAMLDPLTGMITFPYHHGEDLAPIHRGEGLASQILDSGEPLLLNRDIDLAAKEMKTQRVGVRAASYLGVPILAGRHTIGVISVQSTQEEGRFGESDVNLLMTIAANAGAAIRNAQLLAETQRRASEMATLNEIGREAAASLDLPTVLDSITRRARTMLRAKTSAVILLDDDGFTLRPIAAAGDAADEVTAFTWKLGEGIIGDIVKGGHAERVSDAASDTRAVHIEGTEEAAPNEKIMVAPLFARETVIGAMAVWRDAGQDVFDDNDLSFLTSLSQQAGASIYNARLFDEVQRQKQYSEAMVENSPAAILTTDLDARVVSWNPAAENLFGFTAQEAIGQNIDNLIANEAMRDEAKALTTRGLEAGRFSGVMRRVRKDGSLVDVEAVALPVIVGEQTVGFIAIYHDITELKRTEEALLQQKEYLEAVVLNSPVAIVTADQDAVIVSWNPAAEKLFGYTAAEAIGEDIDALIAASDSGMHAEAVEFSQQARDGRLHVNTQRVRKDGSLVDVELLGVPVTVDGEQAGIIAIYHDITELKRATEEAEAANQAKSAFLATMSHEIRTPMNAVIGMGGLLLDTDLTDEQREFAEIIRSSSDALLAIINDILDFSKIEAGKMDLEYQPFDLRECVEGTLDLVAGRAFEKNLDLAYVIEDGTPTRVIGDVTRFRQILLNLLTNAVKFTDRGEVVVTINADESLPAQGRDEGQDTRKIHVAVRDTGIGIPKDRMDRLFQSFSQVDASTARKYGGTGLGLAISRRLAEMMRGTMWAESYPGQGATFHFTLMAQEAEDSAEAPAGILSADPHLKGRRVLVVDDNDTNRRILSLQVKGWGMLPRDTHSPHQALEWIEAGEPFDVAILDMHMPDFDGLSLAREIRNHRDRSTLPMILFTSLGRREVDADDIDFSAYLTKPIKPSQLLDALSVVFAEQPSRVKRRPDETPAIDPELGHKHPLRVLLAEDNAVNQKLALRLLAQMGYRADVAANGQEALESLGRQDYDVVLMDVQMPEMDGLEASRQINRRWTQAERPRIVAMTANAMQGDRERCLEAGMDDYITKPVRVQELMEALTRVPARGGPDR